MISSAKTKVSEQLALICVQACVLLLSIVHSHSPVGFIVTYSVYLKTGYAVNTALYRNLKFYSL